MTGLRLYVITFAMMLSLFLASIEATVIATAMPTIVAELGGLEIYAWVFSAYMLASTTMVPIFGKLSDIYGRRRIYLIAVTLFLIGAMLCTQAQSMPQLVFFRVIQGLGAGGLQPLAFTIIGDIFTFEQRAKMQGLFSGVWGVSSLVGPLIGGFLVDYVAWQWVFWLNLPFGVLAVALMLAAWRPVHPRTGGKVDYWGAALLSGGVVMLMLALFELRAGRGINLVNFGATLLGAIVLFGALLWVERRAENPILPLTLFRDRLFVSASGHGFLAGFALFGGAAFVPLFAQAVLGTSATAAGATLTPQLLCWTVASIIGSRLLLRFSYRSLALTGMTLFVIGASIMTQVSQAMPAWVLGLGVGLMGTGMGLSIPTFLIAVQAVVPRQSLGTATATVQFSRSIGGAVGTSVMGMILAAQLAAGLTATGLDPNVVSMDVLLEAHPLVPAATIISMQSAMATAMQSVFLAGLVAGILAWGMTALAPRERIGQPTPVKPAARA